MQIINVMASSIDGKIGGHRNENDGDRIDLGLSSEADRQFLRGEVSSADAIIVGATSIRANGSCLDWLGRDQKVPHWYIYCQSPIPLDLEFWNQHHIPRTLVSAKTLPKSASNNLENIVYGSENPAAFLVKAIQSKGYTKVLLFGGGILNGFFYKGNFVNELHLSLAPMMLASPLAPSIIQGGNISPVQMKLLSLNTRENFVFLYYHIIGSINL